MILVLEIVMICAASAFMYRVASADNGPGGLWSGLTVAACIASWFVTPWPLIRIGAVVVLMFALMFGVRLLGGVGSPKGRATGIRR